jgi:hypothetical protein
MSLNENKKIVEEINDELENKKREELKLQVRAYKQSQLEEQERLKAEKEKIEEKLRIIKLNLENLDKGNFQAIEERMRKSEQARGLSLIWNGFNWSTSTWNPEWTSGTYIITTPFGKKTFYF